MVPISVHHSHIDFGGKRAIAAQVWQWLGDVPNYVEGFFGSGAVLLARPEADPARHVETINDLDGMVANFWRAVQADPEAVAHYADWPVNENDLHARHAWLVGQKSSLQARLEGDPDWYDGKVAGWWVWGLSCWIGGHFCSGAGPWQQVDGQLVHLGDTGQGVHRKPVHLGDTGKGVYRRRVHLHVSRGIHKTQGQGLLAWMQALAARLRSVRVCCGAWHRVCGPTPTIHQGLTGVFLDPPYGASVGRSMGLYAQQSGSVAGEVRQWCLDHGHDPRLRVVLCGYDNEHDVLLTEGWQKYCWATQGGYSMLGKSRGRENRHREVCWRSPHCLTADDSQLALPF